MNIKLTSKENYSKLILISLSLIIFTTFNNTFIAKPEELADFNNLLIWLNLFNWLPIFLLSWCFRNYLREKKQTLLCFKYFLAGSIPVLISCGLQLWFGFDKGPYEILNGLIIWFQYPIEGVGGITGLFNNQNITGIWLTISLAISFGLLKKENNLVGRFFLVFINCLIIYFIFLTNSRNALFGLIIAFFVANGIKKSFIFLVSSFSFFYITNFFYLLTNTSPLINSKFIPIGLFSKLDFSYSFLEDRLIIWKEAITLILSRPLSGWGGGTFPYLFPKEKIDFAALHTHNIPLELAYNFGIPTAIFLSFFVLKIGFYSFKKINYKNKKPNNFFDRYWFLIFLILVISHTSDITFFDGRVSIFFSITIASLLNIIHKPLKIKTIK